MAVCPFCREPIAPNDVRACPSCHTPHHAPCWQENRGCTVFGCQCAPPDEPKLSISSASVMGGANAGAGATFGSRYLLARNGQQFGPYSLEELRQFVAQHRATDADLVWTEGMPQWVPLRQVLGPSQSAMPPRHSAAPPPLYGASQPQPQHYQQPASVYNIGGQPHGMVKPESYLVWAILVTVLCCVPFGIVSIIYAAQVDKKFVVGDYAGAQVASSFARGWAIAGLVGGLIVIFFAFLGPIAASLSK